MANEQSRNAVVPAGRFVAYYRVSTDRQGHSGLGLDAQRQAVTAYLDGGDRRLAGEFTEVESGRRNDRPQLAAALAACRRHGATLIVAKLDRLARNVAFISSLMESGVEFVACDFPQANRLTLHILAAVAEHERELISQRTKAALAAVKARGEKRLGNPRLDDATRARAHAASLAARRAKAGARAASLRPVVEEIRAAGHAGPGAVARELNRRGVPAPRGGAWAVSSVRRAMTGTGVP